MIDTAQFRVLIVRPALKYLEPQIPYSRVAEDLLVGTAMQESLLTYVHQVGGGPALGIFQMEPITHRDLRVNYLGYRPDLYKKINMLAASRWNGPVPADEMIANVTYAAAMCRAHYWRDKMPLPDEGDIHGLGKMWKVVYNTGLGKGSIDEFIHNYSKLEK